MKFATVFAVAAAATVANAQGYNQTRPSQDLYDSRTVSVPKPSHGPTTALTSIYTITSNCGSATVFLPSTKVFPLTNPTVAASASATTAKPSQFTGAAPVPSAAVGGAVVGFGGLIAAALIL